MRKKRIQKRKRGSDTQGATQGTKRRGGRSGDKQTKGQGWMEGWMDGDGRNYDTPILTKGWLGKKKVSPLSSYISNQRE